MITKQWFCQVREDYPLVILERTYSLQHYSIPYWVMLYLQLPLPFLGSSAVFCTCHWELPIELSWKHMGRRSARQREDNLIRAFVS